MTGSASDPLDWQPHIRNKPRREALANRFRDPHDPLQDRDRPRHVADRLRRAVPAHDVRRQADARPRADAGHRPREPRLQGQARRAGRRLPRPRRRAEAGARDLHRERRHGQDGARPGRGRRRDAGEVRGLPRPVPRLRLVAVDRRARRTSGSSLLPAAQEHILAQEDGKDRLLQRRDASCRRRSRSPCRTTRRCASATTSASSRPCAPCSPRARPASARPTRTSTTRSGRSSRGPSSSDEVIDIFAAAGPEEARHLDPVRRVPGRGPRHAAAEPRRRAAAEAAERRDQDARSRRNVVQARSFAEMLEQALRTLPEPRHRDGAGDRGADRAREGDARGRTRAARSSA